MGTGNGGTSASSDSHRMLYSIHGRGTAGATLRGTASGNPGAVGGLRRVHTSLAARGGCRTTGGRRARRWSRRLRAYVRVRSADHQMQPSAEPHAEHTGVGGSAWRTAEDRVRLLPSDSCGWCAGIGTSAPWGLAGSPPCPEACISTDRLRWAPSDASHGGAMLIRRRRAASTSRTPPRPFLPSRRSARRGAHLARRSTASPRAGGRAAGGGAVGFARGLRGSRRACWVAPLTSRELGRGPCEHKRRSVRTWPVQAHLVGWAQWTQLLHGHGHPQRRSACGRGVQCIGADFPSAGRRGSVGG